MNDMHRLPTNFAALARLFTLALAGALLAGCATVYTGGERGVYYQDDGYRTARVVHVDPFIYPYWSLDYFYYSRYYHPYSVVVHRFDPWYYPYPGWYYGYWPGPRFAGHRAGFHYPWYRYRDYYGHYRPWWPGFGLSFGYYHDPRGRYSSRDRVRAIDQRLRTLETQRSLAARGQRPDRRLQPLARPATPAAGRAGAAHRRATGNRPGSPGRSEQQAIIERLRSRPASAAGQRRPVPAGSYRRPPAASPRRGEHNLPPAAPAPPRSQAPRRPQSRPAPPDRAPVAAPRPARSRSERRSPPPARRSQRPGQGDRHQRR